MSEDRLANIIEILELAVTFCGFIAVVVSLKFLIRQTKLLTDQTELLAQSTQCDSYSSITNSLSLTKQIFIEHPKLRQYFYRGVDISENHEDYDQVQGIAEHLLDFFDGILLQNKKTRVWEESFWEAYFKDSFRNSPVLCARLKKNKDWYTPQLYALMEAAIPTQPTAAEHKTVSQEKILQES